ncbi:MAG: hypothetical protein ACYDC1_18445 [Limisphaerales bacterium]
METQPPSYRREFARSPHHGWMALATVGLGFLSAQPLFLIAGVTAYALGWLYVPDLPLFRRWVDRRTEAAQRLAQQAQVAAFLRKREALLGGLSPTRRDRYRDLGEVCRNIEAASTEGGTPPAANDPRLRKLDELMWTFLRLLTIEESLERFLETERREDVPALVREADGELARLNSEIEALRAKGNASILDSRQRLLGSRQERLEVLKKRLQRIDQAKENLALVVSEQERLDQQIKLIRADAVASRNAEALSARIDATVEHLDQTNKWLSEMDQFKDLVGDLPATESRIGFENPVPPVLPAGTQPAPYTFRDRRSAQTIRKAP